MQEAPRPLTQSDSAKSPATYAAMIVSGVIGLLLSILTAHLALSEINDSEIRFRVPTNFDLKGTVTPTKGPEGLPSYSSTVTEAESRRTVVATMETSMDGGWSVRFPKPNRPWLCIAFILLLSNSVLYVRHLYMLVRRSKGTTNLTDLHSKVMAASGLMFFAGNEQLAGSALLGIAIMAYAGLVYLAYARWERVRAQLYKA